MMGKFTLNMEDSSEKIYRSAIRSIVEDICTSLDVDNKVYKIMIDSQIDKDLDQERISDEGDTNFTARIDVDYEENSYSDLSTSYGANDYDAVRTFEDKDASFSIDTLYVTKELVLTLKFANKSKVGIKNIINNVKKNFRFGIHSHNHSMELRYNLPKSLDHLFNIMAVCRNNALGTNLTVDEYVAYGNKGHIGIATDSKGNNATKNFYILNKFDKLAGYYTNLNLNDLKVQFDKDKTLFFTEIQYRFSIDYPFYVKIDQPFFAYNQQLPERFISFSSVLECYSDNIFRGESDLYNDFLKEVVYNEYRLNKTYLTFPRFDDFVFPEDKVTYTRVMSLVGLINPTDKRTMFNLLEIPGITWEDEVVAYMKKHHASLNEVGGALFLIELYNRHNLLGPILTIDENLNIVANEDLDIKGQYRVSISVIKSTSYLKDSVKEELESDKHMLDVMRTYFDIDSDVYCREELHDRYNNEGIINDDRVKILHLPTASYINAFTNLFK